MLHKKLVEPALENLEGERAEYFTRVMQRLDEDKRVEAISNLIYLSLRESIPYLPPYLSEQELVGALIDFVEANKSRLNKAIFDRSFIESPGDTEGLKAITNEFVGQVLKLTLQKYEQGVVDAGESTVYRFDGSYEDGDFPYPGLDDDDEPAS